MLFIHCHTKEFLNLVHITCKVKYVMRNIAHNNELDKITKTFKYNLILFLYDKN